MTETILLVLVAILAAGLGLALFAWARAANRGPDAPSEEDRAVAAQMAAQIASMMRAQGEITGHVQSLTQRLDNFGHKVGQSVADTGKSTNESLAKLGERLAVIDKAQQTITALSGQVVELQHILANKQTRGAFGQGRMEAIVRDGLPLNAYQFQATLSNGTRPDCLITFPSGPGPRRRRQVSAGSLERHPRAPPRPRPARRLKRNSAATPPSTSRISPTVISFPARPWTRRSCSCRRN